MATIILGVHCRRFTTAFLVKESSNSGALARCCKIAACSSFVRLFSSDAKPARVAVLYQALEPPMINGVRKPMKLGGYEDSGADIAYALQKRTGTQILTPIASPEPRNHSGWCFPDTEEGILLALEANATHLWANTILFSSHPLQKSPLVEKYQDEVNIIGQPPQLVEQYDDKEYVNNLLRSKGCFSLPRGWKLSDSLDIDSIIEALELPFPVVAKPIRGRGSYGVKVCRSDVELISHARHLFAESPSIMIEEFLSGEEATVSVMPPSAERPEYWSLPIVSRFNHEDGIAPYNGVVAVVANSSVVSQEEYDNEKAYGHLSRECTEVAKLLRVTAPIRIDARRFKKDGKFALFDINMKPNMTGAGRPGRENQASLTALAAAELGWNYSRLLHAMLESSKSLRELREIRLEV